MSGYGMLGGLPPGLRGMIAAEQMGQQRSQSQLGMLGGMMQLNNQVRQQAMAEQMAPLQLEQARLALDNARNPAPKWQVSERFNEATGKKEKVIVDLNNPANVIPFGGQEARNLSFQNTGKEIVGLDPTTGAPVGAPVAVTASPHQEWQQTTQFPWQQQVDRAQVGNAAAGVNNAADRLFYETGVRGSGGMGLGAPRPVSPGIQMPGGAPVPSPSPTVPPLGTVPPRGAPTAPQNIVPDGTQMPVAAPLPPRVQNELAAEKAKKEAELATKRQYNMTGINDALNEAEAILKGRPDEFGKPTADRPTGSWMGVGQDALFGAFGVSRSGAPQAAQLKSIAGSLVAKMPRMEGPQSDKDVQMYREMAGQIGDDTIPIRTRLAALDSVRKLYAKYENSPGGQPAPKTPQRRSGDVINAADAILGLTN